MNNRKNEARMSNDSRLAILETTILNINASLQDIKQDFKRLDSKFDALDKKFDSKIDALDKKFDSKIDALDKKFDSKTDALDKKIDSKIDALDKKFDTKFDLLQNRIWSNFLWLMGMIIGLAGLIAHTQHWL
ncbi:MAG TPA: hypothetical protein VLI69_05460 [Gammaproteobacteria bacterium]|nr:hypothetical protein [Gammaproteobacteria bacterium]